MTFKDPVCHGTAISNGLNKIPGMNSFAALHDQWMIDLKFAKDGVDMSFIENVGSMPPALILNYGALYDKYRVVIEGVRVGGKE